MSTAMSKEEKAILNLVGALIAILLPLGLLVASFFSEADILTLSRFVAILLSYVTALTLLGL